MVLHTLDWLGPLHGYAIAARLEQGVERRAAAQYGTPYPALMRLEQGGPLRGKGHCRDQSQGELSQCHVGRPRQLASEDDAWGRMSASSRRCCTARHDAGRSHALRSRMD
jgi:PadR family transcriptional regulator, regulatory protein PadR